MYLTWYGFGRMLIEGLRTDSLYVLGFRISQIVGFLCFFIGICILTAMEIIRYLRKKDASAVTEAAVNEEATEVKEEIKEEKKDDGVFEIADSYSDDDDE